MGEQYDSDLIIYGDYEIKGEIIYIKISIMDIFKGIVADEIFYEGKIGIDIYRIIDEAVFKITESISSIIKKIEKEKSFEFNIGGSLSYSFLFKFSSYERKMTEVFDDKYNDSETYYTSFGYLPYAQVIMFSIPVSFIYYPTKISGIGFNASNGFNLFLSGFKLSPLYFDFFTKFYLVNKLKSANKQECLLLEFGLIFELKILNEALANIEDYVDIFIRNNLQKSFYLGSGFFLGHEKYSKNGFSYIVGGYIESLFLINAQYNSIYTVKTDSILIQDIFGYNDFLNIPMTVEYSKYFLSFIEIGVEFRFQYKYFKKIKKDF